MITIIGIGNTLYSDEGVGVQALPFIEEALKGKDVEIVEGSTDGIRLLEPIEDTDHLIIIDAINAGKPSGTIIKLESEQIPIYAGVKMSVHQLGLQEVLGMAKLRERLPNHMAMFGIQPESLKLGLELSEIVKQQLPELVRQVCEQVKTWSE